MKIDIGCVVDLCEATAFAEIQCNGFDEPAFGLFLPAGWGSTETSSKPEPNAFTSIGFYCPQHNPALKKAGVTVEEKDQAVVKLPEGETEPENLLRCSVRIAQGEVAKLADLRIYGEVCGACGKGRLISWEADDGSVIGKRCTKCSATWLRDAGCEKCADALVADCKPDVDFHMASVVDDPVNPDCRVKAEVIEPVTDPDELVELGKPARPLAGAVDLFEHHHPTVIGPTQPAVYQPEDARHAHKSPVGLTSWELQTENHTHLIDIGSDDKTGPPIPREVEQPPIADVDLKGHCHETKAGPTGPAQYREDDSKHAHNPGLGLTTWADETPGHTHLMDKVGSERTGPPIVVDEIARRAKALNEARVLSVSDVEDRVIDHMECDTANYQTSVPIDVWEALTAAFGDLTGIARERVKAEELPALGVGMGRALEILARASEVPVETEKGLRIGEVYRDGDDVVRIELEPGVELGEAVEGLQRALACVQEAGGEGSKKIAVVRRDEQGRVLVELEPGIEADLELVKTMQVAWLWAQQAEQATTPGVDFHMASVIDNPLDPLCRVKTGVTVEEKDQATIELPDGVTEPENLARCTVKILQPKMEALCLNCGSGAPKTGPCPKCGIDNSAYKTGPQIPREAEPVASIDRTLYEHYHPTLIGSTEPAQYRPGDSKHAHASSVGPTSWELQTTDHTHEIDIINGNRTGLPMLREAEPAAAAKNPDDALRDKLVRELKKLHFQNKGIVIEVANATIKLLKEDGDELEVLRPLYKKADQDATSNADQNMRLRKQLEEARTEIEGLKGMKFSDRNVVARQQKLEADRDRHREALRLAKASACICNLSEGKCHLCHAMQSAGLPSGADYWRGVARRSSSSIPAPDLADAETENER